MRERERESEREREREREERERERERVRERERERERERRGRRRRDDTTNCIISNDRLVDCGVMEKHAAPYFMRKEAKAIKAVTKL